MGIAWYLLGIVMALSIVGLPWARACFTIGRFTFFPFGKEAIPRDQVSGREDIGTSAFGSIGNVIWVIVAGLWLAIGHITTAAAQALTIIGLPFAWQNLKLARISLAPIGLTIVDHDDPRRMGRTTI